MQTHKSTEVPIRSESPKPNFQSGLRIKDEFLMERVSCLLASSHVQLIYASASALLVKTESLCIANPASFMLQVNVFSPGSQKVTAGCFSSCGLWAMWLPLNTFFLLTLLSSSSGVPNRRLSVPRLLVSLAAVNPQVPPV